MRAFLPLLYHLAHLGRVETARSPTILRVVVEHTVFVVMRGGNCARNRLKVVQVQVLIEPGSTLTSG